MKYFAGFLLLICFWGPVGANPPVPYWKSDILQKTAASKRLINAPAPSSRSLSHALKELKKADLKAHMILKESGADQDLKCILMGLSRDLDQKIKALSYAKTPQDQKAAIGALDLLLDEHIEILNAPKSAQSGMDCVIEFGEGIKSPSKP